MALEINHMGENILGLHHITAIAGDAQRNYDFYTRVLGLRLVKKTVNFDAPGTYHFYYGNESGTPGTLLTFFPWMDINPGYPGTGMATLFALSVPGGSLDAWSERLNKFKVKQIDKGEIFGEPYLAFDDPDGLKIHLTIPEKEDSRPAWSGGGLPGDTAIKGIHGITLTIKDITATASLLTEVFGYKLFGKEPNCYRFVTDAMESAAVVDLIESPGERAGYVAGGTNHHVAFRVKDENTLMNYREKLAERGLHVTNKIDRNYFYSIYFREPGGVLFELATNNPGFTVDEPLDELGMHLRLPAQYEQSRAKIEAILPQLVNPDKK